MIPDDVLEYSLPIYFMECHQHISTSTLIIAFTSHGNSGRAFEFYNVLKQYDKAHVLFLSSLYKNGYYIDGGLSDRYPSFSYILPIINSIIEKYNISKIICIGEGSGGTGAVYYGWQLSEQINTSILAFAPYNSLPTGTWNLIRDVCAADPYPLHRINFNIYLDPNFKPERARISGLASYMTIIQIVGRQHLAKSSYITGKLFEYLDAELPESDQLNIKYSTFYNWAVSRL